MTTEQAKTPWHAHYQADNTVDDIAINDAADKWVMDIECSEPGAVSAMLAAINARGDLLDVCEHLVKCADEPGVTLGPLREQIPHGIKLARAAIAKATGKDV